MNLIHDVPPLAAPQTRRIPNLILHCGAHAAEWEDVTRVRTPNATRSWHPIPHHHLIEMVRNTLSTTGLDIGVRAHSLTKDGMRYFGLMEVRGRHTGDDYCWVLGVRNSHDKSFPAGIVAGASVFVCDNLSFSGEVRFSRKHTRFIDRDLPQLVERAIGRLTSKWHDQDKRIAAYKRAELTDRDAHDLVIRSTDVGVCNPRQIPRILQEWRHPLHQQFERRDSWALFNAFTEALKRGSLTELPRKTEALHGLLDAHVGLALNQN